MKGSYILAIETSCDDTCIAVSRNDEVLSNVCISSQAAHKTYGGIVPEIAARSHQTNLSKCYEQAIKKAKIQPNQLTHVAYTALPGLPGSLHMGKFFAKSIATLLHIPLIPINHMYGHIYSFAIDNITLIKYPFLALIISGGHTAIYFVKSINNVEILNETADDAAGEVLDKIGRALNFAYPGGISIDNVFNPKKTNTKLIHHFKPEEKFSFSGIKTHILNLINQNKLKKLKIDDIAIASSLLK
jgi:N6-L-threonylcarbamoyladenine synthase